ncbi:very short patch repair endonuclease [Neorhizobium galegae]|uniref:very short patch repair endonuclease n=1 Tax=Neorhizobium galegae TaxID=399 RepID=UPI000627CC4D|nr:very short patch repair endonuclease [Neorhizobium galegae]
MDIVSPSARSRMMAMVKSKNTMPELWLRHGLHAMGFRYRIHVNGLPGKPDIVFPGRKAVIFVNGCFWHGHDCPKGRLPKTRKEFWCQKIASNKERDERNIRALASLGWRALIIWECATRDSSILEYSRSWLNGSEPGTIARSAFGQRNG